MTKGRKQPANRRDVDLDGSEASSRWFWLLTLGLLAIPAGLLVWLAPRALAPGSWAEDRLMRYAASRMSEEEQEQLHTRLAQTVPGLWQPVPEPDVTYLLQSGIDKRSKGARVRSNRAGMRSAREYVPKSADRFRIVCLGDSLVMGTGGRERDRWGDQLEDVLRQLGVRVDGREVEVYSLGLDGWTALNEATYLTSRLSAYRPDVVLVMMFQNDVTDSGAVLGTGLVTYRFSSESRRDGSGVMIGSWPQIFGAPGQNLLYAGIGSESLSRWHKIFTAWKRLEDLVSASGGRMVFGFLRANPLFGELAKLHFAQAGMRSPMIVSGYFGHKLPHDPHPDRTGHRILATHYLHTLASLGWLPVDPDALPPLHPELDTRVVRPPNARRLRELQDRVIRRELDESIAFDRLSRRQIPALLGGLYPGRGSELAGSVVFGSPRGAFLLRRKPAAKQLVVTVQVPPRIELYPFELELRIDGEPSATLRLERSSLAGRHSLAAALPPESRQLAALEVVLRTDSYWTEIDDPVMKSYRLLAARQE